MYQDAIKNIKNSIFPIFFVSVQGQNTQVGVSGTGFFISNQGHFLTALHVITDIPANSKFQYRGNIPDHIVNPPNLIQEIYRDPIRDIFLGRINIDKPTPVAFSLDKPEAGKSICLCGYPLAILTQHTDGTLNVSGVRQYWQPTFIIDAITVTDETKNYLGFITQDTSLNGMSGGPVFDNTGVVYGVDTAFITREIPQAFGKASIQVHNGVVLENASITDVYAMIKQAK